MLLAHNLFSLQVPSQQIIFHLTPSQQPPCHTNPLHHIFNILCLMYPLSVLRYGFVNLPFYSHCYPSVTNNPSRSSPPAPLCLHTPLHLSGVLLPVVLVDPRYFNSSTFTPSILCIFFIISIMILLLIPATYCDISEL